MTIVSLLSGLLLTKVRNLTLFSYVQVVFDTVFVSGIVLLSGGLGSPFLVLYHLAILNAAYLLFRPGALIAASVAAVCYGTMVNLLYYGVLPPLGFDTLAFLKLYATPTLHLTLHLIAAVSSFYLVAVLGSYLIQRLTQVETLLAERDVAFDQLSSLYQGVVQNLESGVLITNASGSIEYANAPMAEILDTTSAQLQGKSATALFPMLPESPPTAPIEFSLPSTGPDTKERLHFSPVTERGRYVIDGIVLKLPIFGLIIRKAAVARFTRTLGTLIASGVPLLEAMFITGKTAGNKVVEGVVLSSRQSISEGRMLTEPLAESKVFPPMLCQMIDVGEQTGAVDAMLNKIADFYEDEVDDAVANLTALMEPLVIVFTDFI